MKAVRPAANKETLTEGKSAVFSRGGQSTALHLQVFALTMLEKRSVGAN